MTLLHFIALTVKEKYPDLANFWHELHFVEKAAAGEGSLAQQACPHVQPGQSQEAVRRGNTWVPLCYLLSDHFKAFHWGHGQGPPQREPSYKHQAQPSPSHRGAVGAGRGRQQWLFTTNSEVSESAPETAFLRDALEVLRKATKPPQTKGSCYFCPSQENGGSSIIGDQHSLWLAFLCCLALHSFSLPL